MKLYFTVLSTFFCLLFSSSSILATVENGGYDADDLPYVEIKKANDLPVLSKQVHDFEKVIMLEVSASDCSYCYLLEEEIIKPMLRSGDYNKTVIIRSLKMDSFDAMKDFNGNEATAAALAKKYKVQLTPTLLFLDVNGNEVAERIIGVNSLDFFGSYVDEALMKGLIAIKKS